LIASFWQSWTPSDSKKIVIDNSKTSDGLLETLQGQVNIITALIYETDYYAFYYLSHTSIPPIRDLSYHRRPNITLEGPCLLGCVSTTPTHGLKIYYLLFPLFYSRAVRFSHFPDFLGIIEC
jgi:hypothetical protein